MGLKSEFTSNKRDFFIIDKKKLAELKIKALKNISNKFRICIHKSNKDLVHEMIVVHTKNTSVPPHMHQKKSESLFVIQGQADLVVFNKLGKVKKILKLGPVNSGKIFYYKIPKKTFHTFIFKSNFFIFKETTKGPFVRKQMIVPKWSLRYKKEILKFKKL